MKPAAPVMRMCIDEYESVGLNKECRH